MAAVGRFVGVDAKAYTSLTGVGGTWVALEIIGSVKMPLTHGEAEVMDRSVDWVGVLLGLKRAEITFRLSRVTGNTQYETIRDAYINRTVLGYAFMSQAIADSGAEGLQLNGVVTGFELTEEDEEAASVDVTVKPYAGSATQPTFVEIA